MKRFGYSLIIVLLPFVIMAVVNESCRPNIQGHTVLGVSTINPKKFSKNTCSWACHNNTFKCIQNHSTWSKGYQSRINVIYFGIINFLSSFGNYGLANLVFLVTLWPTLMFTLFLKTANNFIKIKRAKQHG